MADARSHQLCGHVLELFNALRCRAPPRRWDAAPTRGHYAEIEWSGNCHQGHEHAWPITRISSQRWKPASQPRSLTGAVLRVISVPPACVHVPLRPSSRWGRPRAQRVILRFRAERSVRNERDDRATPRQFAEWRGVAGCGGSATGDLDSFLALRRSSRCWGCLTDVPRSRVTWWTNRTPRYPEPTRRPPCENRPAARRSGVERGVRPCGG